MRSFVLLFLSVPFLGCSKPVNVILPDGYANVSVSIQLRDGGREEVAVNGRYEVYVAQPTEVRNQELFEQLHRATFQYADGTRILRQGDLSDDQPDTVAIRGATYSTGAEPPHRRGYWFFVGTKEQYRTHNANPF